MCAVRDGGNERYEGRTHRKRTSKRYFELKLPHGQKKVKQLFIVFLNKSV